MMIGMNPKPLIRFLTDTWLTLFLLLHLVFPEAVVNINAIISEFWDDYEDDIIS